jgi:hypothetical protein
MSLLPDTTLVTRARALLEGATDAAMVNHSLRSHLLGAAYGKRKGIAFDEETLALAALFHDLAMIGPYADRSVPFTVASSRAMRAELEPRGVPRERIERIADAIEFHMQCLPRFDKGPEAGLLQVGAWMDATGLRRWAIPAEARAIGASLPRAGFDRAFPGRLLGSIGNFRACQGLMFPPRA